MSGEGGQAGDLSEEKVQASASSGSEGLSKKQLKRKLKQERLVESRRLKKEAAKRRKRERKAESAPSLRNEAVLSSPEAVERREQRRQQKEQARVDRTALCRRNWAVVVDCGWEDIHAERPLVSLAQQVLFCYGANNRSSRPCEMFLTGVGPRLMAQLSKSGVTQWHDVHCRHDEYSTPTFEGRPLVYLTADAEETLEDLDTNVAYIIGGIVDRNAHKGVTLRKAQEQGVRAAKLPIREHCEMSSSCVLTVNQIFSILLRYGETRSWRSAVAEVIPHRKQSDKPGKTPDLSHSEETAPTPCIQDA